MVIAPRFTPQLKSCPSHGAMVRAPAPGSSGVQSDPLAELPRIVLETWLKDRRQEEEEGTGSLHWVSEGDSSQGLGDTAPVQGTRS